MSANSRNMLQKLIMSLILILTFNACSSILGKSSSSAELKVTFFEVGQGDSVLLSCPENGPKVLIDAGMGVQHSEKFLKQLRAEMGQERKLFYAISLSSHPNHIGGFLELLQQNEFTIENFLESGIRDPRSTLDDRVRERISEKGIKHFDFSLGRIATLEVCPGSSSRRANLLFFPLSDIDSLAIPCEQKPDECSLISRLEYKGMSVLLASNIAQAREEILLRDPAFRERLRADILKVGSFGSERSNSSDFLQAVNPKYAVVSADGKSQNDVLSTSPGALDRLNDLLNRKYPDQISKREIILPRCQPLSEVCENLTISLHDRLFHTAIDGPIRFIIREAGVTPLQ